MIGIVMAGGRGSRMGLPREKLLLEYKKPVVLHVLDAMLCSGCFSSILAVTSPNSPRTQKLVAEKKYPVIKTPGNSYAEDLNAALQSVDGPAFVAPADLPLLDGEAVRRVVRHYDPGVLWTSVLVTRKFLGSLGLSSDFGVVHAGKPCHYAGISLVNASKIGSFDSVPESYLIIDDKRIAFNLNTQQDYELLGTA